MKPSSAPLVSVVMPVYNGEQFIADAIRSVQAQTYPNWDLTIGNNWSKDRTLAIAEEFAAQDSRIRIVTYSEFVSVVESHNNAFTLISPDAKYCKLLGADDLLFPNCLEEMVRVAESHPTAGVIVSYVLAGDEVIGHPYKYPDAFVPGREVGRYRFLQNTTLFAGPSQSLIRADILRAKRPFYAPLNYHGDIEAYLDLLQHYDLGFVHQVLTYMRTGAASRTTSYLGRVQSAAASRMDELTKFGGFYLSPQECADRLAEATRTYYQFLGHSVWELRAREFWQYHLKHVRDLGYPPKYGRIAWHAFLRLLDIVGNPLRSVRGFVRRIGNGRRARRVLRESQSHGPAPKARTQSMEPTERSSGPAATTQPTTTAR